MLPLAYQVDPAVVAYSASADSLSIVRLTIRATNPNDGAIAISRLELELPLGSKSMNDALSTDATSVVASAGNTTPWAMLAAGNGRWNAVPLPPAIGLGPRETIAFVLSNIVVNQAPGKPQLTITNIGDGSPPARLTIDKNEPSDKGHEVPRILSFTADPNEVAEGGETTLAWQIESAVSAVLQPGGVPLPNPLQGHVLLPVDQTTVFVLDATGYGGVRSATVNVTVRPVEIERFDADPATPVAPNTAVKLSFATRCASSAAIDQGVGPVPKIGEVTVHPTQTTIYTLTALGREPKTRALTVTVQPRAAAPKR